MSPKQAYRNHYIVHGVIAESAVPYDRGLLLFVKTIEETKGRIHQARHAVHVDRGARDDIVRDALQSRIGDFCLVEGLLTDANMLVCKTFDNLTLSMAQAPLQAKGEGGSPRHKNSLTIRGVVQQELHHTGNACSIQVRTDCGLRPVYVDIIAPHPSAGLLKIFSRTKKGHLVQAEGPLVGSNRIILKDFNNFSILPARRVHAELSTAVL